VENVDRAIRPVRDLWMAEFRRMVSAYQLCQRARSGRGRPVSIKVYRRRRRGKRNPVFRKCVLNSTPNRSDRIRSSRLALIA
jgi:hypothetical protein